MSTAPNRSHETRFKVGNSAARRHGLRAGTRKELRRRDVRTSRLLGKYLAFRADSGRPVGATQLPLARRYVELEVRCRDLFAALQDDPFNQHLHEMHVSATRAQTALAVQLGESGKPIKRSLSEIMVEQAQQRVLLRRQSLLEKVNNG